MLINQVQFHLLHVKRTKSKLYLTKLSINSSILLHLKLLRGLILIINTRMEKDVTIMTPVPTEYSPDANGRYGLLTCNETYRIKLQFEIHKYKVRIGENSILVTPYDQTPPSSFRLGQ